VSLYADESFREAARPTDDVDVVVELVAYNDYAAMEIELRKAGFENDNTSNDLPLPFICVWRRNQPPGK
jgi:hypothetical protein